MRFSELRSKHQRPAPRQRTEVCLFGSETLPIDAKAITAGDEAAVLASTYKYCAERGRSEAKPGDELFDLARMTFTLLVGFVDADSPPEAPIAFFDTSAADLMKSVDRETIVYLYEVQRFFQEKNSPRPTRMDAITFVEHVIEVAGADDERPFTRMSSVLQWSFCRTMARLLEQSLLTQGISIGQVAEALGSPSKDSEVASAPESEILQ